jgi:tRNA (guanine-N7-)-methyltransferase
VRHLLPARSVEVFHLLFPDPWPKRRHHRRRIVTPDFLDAVSAALAENGILRIVTDQADYFEVIVDYAGQNENLNRTQSNGFDFPQSTFEKRFQNAGVSIYRLELRKISPVTLTR